MMHTPNSRQNERIQYTLIIGLLLQLAKPEQKHQNNSKHVTWKQSKPRSLTNVVMTSSILFLTKRYNQIQNTTIIHHTLLPSANLVGGKLWCDKAKNAATARHCSLEPQWQFASPINAKVEPANLKHFCALFHERFMETYTWYIVLYAICFAALITLCANCFCLHHGHPASPSHVFANVSCKKGFKHSIKIGKLCVLGWSLAVFLGAAETQKAHAPRKRFRQNSNNRLSKQATALPMYGLVCRSSGGC